MANPEQCPDIAGRDPYQTVSPRDLPRPDEPREVSLTRHIMQSIIAESPYKPDMEWDLWHQAHELEEHNHLPEGVTAQDVIDCYMRVFHHEP